MAWKKGPLPKDTYGWGGVVPSDSAGSGGFYFADFQGDTVKAIGAADGGGDRVLKADEVGQYDNSLELPTNCKGRASA
jgi:hypothetical protein